MSNGTINFKNKGFPVIRLGNVDIFWLSKDYEFQNWQKLLTAEENQKMNSMKATMRANEFGRSRALVHSLFSGNYALSKFPDGHINWPTDIVGSLSHKAGHVALALSQNSNFHSIGIDCESVSKINLGIKSKVITPEEEKHFGHLNFSDNQVLAIIFSLKEALFKCHYPLGQKMFYFEDAYLDTISGTGSITATVKVDTSPMTPAGYSTRGCFHFFEEGGEEYIISLAYLTKES